MAANSTILDVSLETSSLIFEKYHSDYLTVPDTTTLIYHYTSVEALYSIVSSKMFWASDVRFLNDRREIQHSYDLFDDVMELIIRDESDEATIEFASQVKDEVNYLYRTAFAVCFCSESDLLGQWRGYGRDGVGYAMGFDARYLDTLCHFKVCKVVYEQDRQIWILENIIKELLKHVKIHLRKMTSEESRHLALETAAKVETFLVPFKHQSFHEEKEVRLYVPSSKVDRRSNVKYRPVRNLVMPYVEIPLDTGLAPALSTIIIGPNDMMELRRQNLMEFFEINDLQHVAVCPSDVPYRPYNSG